MKKVPEVTLFLLFIFKPALKRMIVRVIKIQCSTSLISQEVKGRNLRKPRTIGLKRDAISIRV